MTFYGNYTSSAAVHEANTYKTRITKLEEELKQVKEKLEKLEETTVKKYVPIPLWEGKIRAAQITAIEDDECNDCVTVSLGECEPEEVNREWFDINSVGVGDYLIDTKEYLYFMKKEEFESTFTKVEE